MPRPTASPSVACLINEYYERNRQSIEKIASQLCPRPLEPPPEAHLSLRLVRIMGRSRIDVILIYLIAAERGVLVLELGLIRLCTGHIDRIGTYAVPV
ncbi:hypothetical protein GWI33_021275 [Rhynchophorus ferrugineus]|uniref:Uncharacterized protein n=1 Tax=Rhynchophorus ferrugineus TaxID=354439 RepID=A0A834HQS9_RHYFE|nr:hypothetical protein GWI33_021275 [Rhynchophorus ferrugineus]